MKKQSTPSKRGVAVRMLVLYAANMCLLALRPEQEGGGYTVCLLSVIFAGIMVSVLRGKAQTELQKQSDAVGILFVLLFLWTLLTVVFVVGDPILYPSPGRILSLMVEEFPRFLKNFYDSMLLLAISFALAFGIAFPLGLVVGSSERLRKALDPYIKVIAPISPIAYIPYIIGIMPTFRAASIFVVFSGTFWPILKWTVHGVLNLDPAYPLTARLLMLPKGVYYKKVVIPGIMPAVLSGMSQSLSGGFAVLVAAEMIGSRSGLGFFIKYFADFLNYHKVLVGILYLGFSVCLVTWLFERLQARLLSWQTSQVAPATSLTPQ